MIVVKCENKCMAVSLDTREIIY